MAVSSLSKCSSTTLLPSCWQFEILGKHLNNMTWGVINVGKSPCRFSLSDRAVVFANLKNTDGVTYLPISPTKIFVAVNTPDRLQRLRALPAREIVHNSNRFLVGRARRFVWAHDCQLRTPKPTPPYQTTLRIGPSSAGRSSGVM
jgi:hypothetical protein